LHLKLEVSFGEDLFISDYKDDCEDNYGLASFVSRLYKYTGDETYELIGFVSGYILTEHLHYTNLDNVVFYLDGECHGMYQTIIQLKPILELVDEHFCYRRGCFDSDVDIPAMELGFCYTELFSFLKVGLLIRYIKVEEKYRAQGYGKYMLEMVERKLKAISKIGFSALYVDNSHDKETLVKFYEKSGYRVISQNNPNYIKNNIVMCKLFR